ncbi:NAD(P)-dependent alcohol dehydrogenase [Aspergillus stella-maris]|uniref:NAD(P)-dependent alcohol dehydrogenase n=1 Tax=Aspergillus stella-maris TaxID=1810926 RepID=UPI003CCCA15B
MSITTKAIVAREPRFTALSWALEDVNVSNEPNDNEVLVEILASGVCHTDIVLSAVPRGQWGITYPKVMGHEGSGYARKIGKNVKGLEIGDPVLLSFSSCGECEQCVERHPSYCDTFALENYVGRKGHVTSAASEKGEQISSRFFGQSSFSRYSIVDSSCILNAKNLINNEEELKLFAPLGCGFQTGMGAIENVACPEEGSVVVVLGLGSVGLAALMTASLRPLKALIGVDRLSSRLDLARSLGATHTLDTSPVGFNLHKAITEMLPTGVATVIDTTGTPTVIEDGLRCLRQRGKLVLIGVPPAQYELGVNAIQHINTGRAVVGCIEGDCVPAEAIKTLIKWYREGRFPIDKLITYFEAHEFKKALAGLDDGTVVKAVLNWKGI